MDEGRKRILDKIAIALKPIANDTTLFDRYDSITIQDYVFDEMKIDLNLQEGQYVKNKLNALDDTLPE